MASITAAGAGSGLDIEGLVTQLVAAERAPVENRLNLDEFRIQSKLSGYGTLKGALSEFQSTVSSLQNLSAFQARSATSSDTSLFSVSASSIAAISSYGIEVSNLAQAHKLASVNFDTADTVVGTGDLTIDVGGDSFQITVTTNNNDTLAQIRDSINGSPDNTGVTASILNVDDGAGGTDAKLILTANDTGESNEISITVNDTDGIHNDGTGLSQLFYQAGDINNQLSEIDQALDATILVDGFTAKSANNTFSDVIQGVTITALKEDPGNQQSLSISNDKAGIKSKIEDFVSKFNDLVSTLNNLTDYDIEEETAGILTGDATARSVETQIRRIISSTVSGITGDINSLASLGISTEKDGTLSIDSAKLDTAVTNNFNEIGEIFASDEGVGQQLDTLLDAFVNSTGIIQSRTNGLDSQLDRIADQRDLLERRIEAIETRFRRQFNAMDAMVAQLTSTGDFLKEQLAITSSIITKKE